jgi:5-hydroxyisourate hydrolase-like protein (transthyretin family)
VERVKLSWIAALCITVVNISAAETVVLLEPFCSSSQHPAISTTLSNRPLEGARVDIYRKTDNGEKLSWTGSTDQQGLARPGEFEPGSYRVLAYSGKLFATLRLDVSNNGSGADACELKFVPPINAEQLRNEILETLARNAPSVQLKEFRGIVQDAGDAVIQRVKIEVLRKAALEKGNVAETLSNEKGQFALPLENGSYVAIFTYLGFKTRAMAFELGNQGWQGVRIAMTVGGSPSSPNAPPQEWKPER